MESALVAAAAYAVSSLTIIFANKFVMQILRDPFALLLSQIIVTLAFSLGAFCFLKRASWNTFFNIQNTGWFAVIGFSSFIGWAASLEGLKSGSVASLTMIKAVNPLMAAILAHYFLPPSQPQHINRNLAWVVIASAGCYFYAYDRATADFRAYFCFFLNVLSASINTVTLKRMQLHSLLPDDAFLSVLCSSALINAAALPFVLVAFLNTASSDVAVQVCSCHQKVSPLISHSDCDIAVCAILRDCVCPELVFFYYDFVVRILGPEAPKLYHIYIVHQLMQNTRHHLQHTDGPGWLRKL